MMEDGQWFETKEGTPDQRRSVMDVLSGDKAACAAMPVARAVISPILANLYLHYALDVWADAWRKKVARGEMIIVRYADDAVLGFQHREEAELFLKQLRERLLKFGLELHPDKTRLMEFGRYASERREKRGEGKWPRGEDARWPYRLTRWSIRLRHESKPSIFWASPTFVGGAARRGISRCIARRSANGWQPS